jgi:acyl transferase domain-containing protein/surfactin synthase thioesterase subunit/acyl carrier protein
VTILPAELQGVAIIGMACRFPGADSLGVFWNNLCDGVESVRFFSDAELLEAGVDRTLLQQSNYVKAAPILSAVDHFDAAFFGYSPREAELLDPQHRLFLEVAWEAFDNAGYHAESNGSSVGVFAGGGGVVTSYLLAHAGHPDLAGQTASLVHLGNDKDFLSTRVSYKLNLTGPSLTVQTACSTSLVAVHLACQSLIAGECDMALGGAATVRIPQAAGYLAEKGNVYSLDGHCRPFDAAGQGTIFGSGVAAILLKRLTDAIADQDHIYAVIKGSAVNNDGGRKVSYTAPSVTGQARAMVEAMALADISPETIGYVECHATGTATGDPLEIEALTRAFQHGTERNGYCAVGSVKGNIGHPEQTAGLASLIKAALAVYHAQLPPTLNFTSPNPAIGFAGSPFYVNSALGAWPASSHRRRAAINSLGIGGTNAFIVIEQAPEQARPAGDERPAHLFTLSAKSDVALRAYLERFREQSGAMSEADLADVCYTSNISRSQLPVRFAGTVATTEELRAILAGPSAQGPFATGREGLRPLAFLFSGQGSQYAGMGAALYRAHPTFREALDRCAAILEPHLDRPLLEVMFARQSKTSLLDQTKYTQPALFSVEYALAQLWLQWHIVPDVVIGHSVGELAAACVAGMVSLEDGLALVAERGRLMQTLPSGAMAAVMAAPDIIRDLIAGMKDRVSIAAINSPQTTVVSGYPASVRELTTMLETRGIRSVPLPVSHAFHSPLMEPILGALEALAGTITWTAPRIPLVSNLTGERLEGPVDARHWRDHTRRPVLFSDGLRRLHEQGIRVFLEVGPGSALLAAGRSMLSDPEATWLPSLGRQRPEWQTVLETLQDLYVSGADVDWSSVHCGASHRRLPMPTYPFQRKRYWLDSRATAPARHLPETGPVHPLLGPRLTSAPEELAFESGPLTPDTELLRDHRIGGAVVLPLTAALEAALVAGEECLGAREIAVQDVVYQEALILREAHPCRMRTSLAVKVPGRAEFRMTASPSDSGGSWPIHLTGIVSRTTTPAGRTRCPKPGGAGRRIAIEHYYAALSKLGLEYGTSFRGIRRLWQGRREALGEVVLPADVSRARHRIHPAFIDACLHVYPAAIEEVSGSSRPRRGPRTTFLPTGVAKFQVHRGGVDEGWAHAVRRDDGRDDNVRVVDIRIYDKSSKLVASIEGLSLRRLAPGDLHSASRADADLLYRARWEERQLGPTLPAPPIEGQRWLVFTDGGGLGRALARRLQAAGQRCAIVSAGPRFSHLTPDHWTLDPRQPQHFHRVISDFAVQESAAFAGVVYLWGLEAPTAETLTLDLLEQSERTGCGGVISLYQALAQARAAGFFPGRMFLVTRNAQDIGTADVATGVAQASLWGLGRTIALEAPAVWGGLLDLPPTRRNAASRDASVLAAELLSPDGEDQIAFRDGKRFVARLARLALDSPYGPPRRARHDGTYLITGGLGMLGQRIARWLVETLGVRSLVLTGRTGARGEAQETVRALQALGARVQVIAADVGVEADVQRVMAAIRRLPPLKGVIHCAGVLHDGILEQMDWPRFTAVTSPKVKGAWLLHQYTRHCALDLFVVQSSLLSLTGSAGQANYTAANAFLDALITFRARSGLAASGINWGPWSEAGMAAARGSRGATMWNARGVRLLPPESGLEIFSRLVADRPVQAVVADIDWPTFLQQLDRLTPFYADFNSHTPLSAAAGSASPGDIATRLNEATPEARRALVVSLLRERITKDLGFKESIDTRQPLNELGLDSLMSVNVANRLEAALGIPVPLVKLIRGPSIEQLVDELFPAPTELAMEGPKPPDAQRVVARSRTSPDGWLVFPRPVAAPRARLFCFPFAGAGATIFRPWADGLAPDIELVAVEPPGRAGRIAEKPVTSIKMFTDSLFPSLLPYLDRPFAFFGHCLGGVTAFESARRLVQDHRITPRHLFVSAARPPHLLDREGAFERRLLASLLGHRAFDPLLPSHEQPDDVFAEIIRQFNIGATEEFLSKPELREALLPAVRADFAMASGYRAVPEALAGLPITCFNGLDDPYVTREDAVAWHEYTRTAFRLHLREGAHFLVVDDKPFILDTIGHELGTLKGER